MMKLVFVLLVLFVTRPSPGLADDTAPPIPPGVVVDLNSTMTLPVADHTATIRWDRGGSVFQYAQRIDEYAFSNTLVRIDGFCGSACTLVTMLPSKQVCVTDRALLWFHAPYSMADGSRDPIMTKEFTLLYPKVIRDWIKKKGGLTPHSIILQGGALHRLFKTCQEI